LENDMLVTFYFDKITEGLDEIREVEEKLGYY
jgi:hypothetical protein